VGQHGGGRRLRLAWAKGGRSLARLDQEGKNMRVMIIALIAILAMPPVARADWAYTKWDMTPDQVVSASKGSVAIIPKEERDNFPGIPLDNAARGSFSDGALKLDVAFAFDTKTNGLVCVYYRVLDPRQDGILRDSLIKRYGAGHHTSAQEATSKNEEYSWVTPDLITLFLSPNGMDPASVNHCKPGSRYH
jgi:hypothetical protein